MIDHMIDHMTVSPPPQLWQSHGLDLYIIPYGCIATGNMMGMIEVVQEADTVAKVTHTRAPEIT